MYKFKLFNFTGGLSGKGGGAIFGGGIVNTVETAGGGDGGGGIEGGSFESFFTTVFRLEAELFGDSFLLEFCGVKDSVGGVGLLFGLIAVKFCDEVEGVLS